MKIVILKHRVFTITRKDLYKDTSIEATHCPKIVNLKLTEKINNGKSVWTEKLQVKIETLTSQPPKEKLKARPVQRETKL